MVEAIYVAPDLAGTACILAYPPIFTLAADGRWQVALRNDAGDHRAIGHITRVDYAGGVAVVEVVNDIEIAGPPAEPPSLTHDLYVIRAAAMPRMPRVPVLRIDELRAERGMSAAELAERAGMTLDDLQPWLDDTLESLDLDALDRIHDALGRPAFALLFAYGDSPRATEAWRRMVQAITDRYGQPVTVKDVAAFFRVSRADIYADIKAKRLKGGKRGRAWVFSPAEGADYLLVARARGQLGE